MYRFDRLVADLRHDPAALVQRAVVRLRLAALRLSNRLSRRSVTGSGAVVVNLTSYGHRIDLVFYALETIAAGRIRPRRLILWLDDAATLANPPATLRRLQRRGLEIRSCPNFGPHKKQYPYALTGPTLPLVAADDDVLYPRRWLAELLEAAAQHPLDVTGQRAHTITFEGDRVAPYARWVAARGTTFSFRTLCTGVSGIYYPLGLLQALRAEGDHFLRVAPRADDLWVYAVAVRHGIRAGQVGEQQAEYPAIPGSQRGTLYRQNVTEGGNDAQFAACVGERERERMLRDDPHDSGPLPGVPLGQVVSGDGA
ncbi:hypothetical protein E3O25_05090 [Cryobacterium sp. TMT1-3]|uniref:Glycosyltransferase family 2 protein n=1 Tax=Cryobacterium luteum TaxID=1424661 RepID=A0A1H8BNA7_9MICO|nr:MULTISPECIES: hypothetical protein [Cryobacterium]TFB89062.1 hypothetical protein E3O10_09145 [Cryobacterium luteum]TFC29602.1 hypothetical protein E3O25_05090 [Cryobacterium sp. TMT1-3]SEM83614.1 hypothetical protein SAMN05216281_10223 [Cryobacterium luteum]